MIFYLSSQGHAATKWISDAFTLHPDVISFHGIRTMPPVTVFEDYDYFGIKLQDVSGYSEEAAENLAGSLYQCAKHSGRVFGAVHTVWGLTCKEPFERRGGQFGGIVRNPVMQFHSIMNAFTPRAMSHDILPVDYSVEYDYMDVIKLNPELFSDMVETKFAKFAAGSLPEKYKKVVRKIKRHSDKKKIDSKQIDIHAKTLDDLRKNRSDEVILDLMATQLCSGLKRVFGDHTKFVANLEPDKIIVMEKITKDFDYFCKKFKIFTGLDYPPENKDEIFNLDHGHQHSKKKKTPEDVWNSWPSQVQEVFRKHLHSNEVLLSFYDEQGYWLPN